MDLFSQETEANLESNLPLAARMRPRNLDEFSGQQQFLAKGKLLRRLLDAGRLSSLLFYGPPGTGKTTLARLLAGETGGAFLQLSAITSGVKDLREVLAKARNDVATGAERPILFVDEIHRFNRSQQDALLPDVEEGIVTLVGATTSNPYFAINGALLSRSQVFQFEPLSEDDLLGVLRRALDDRERGLGSIATECTPGALEYLARAVEGDARRALGVLEVAVLSAQTEGAVVVDEPLLRESMQQKTIQYDRTGDEHYDVSSALIKSIRGSDADAGLYWLARMLEAGEDVRFICRRLVILASEDIGNADPQALQVAVAAMQACEFVGLPECQLTLSQTVIYLALAPKSNAATAAIGLARREVLQGGAIPVPRHLRDGHYAGAAELGNANDYEYSHDAADGVADQDYLGVERHFLSLTDRGWEGGKQEYLNELRNRFRPAKS